MLNLSGKESPKETIQYLEQSGYWFWDWSPSRSIYTNGVYYAKVSHGRPTHNHLESLTSPPVWSTPTLSVIITDLFQDPVLTLYK